MLMWNVALRSSVWLLKNYKFCSNTLMNSKETATPSDHSVPPKSIVKNIQLSRIPIIDVVFS